MGEAAAAAEAAASAAVAAAAAAEEEEQYRVTERWQWALRQPEFLFTQRSNPVALRPALLA